jgi:opacity protein-like surface antigen
MNEEKFSMRKLILAAFFIASTASLSLAQTADEYPRNEFFAGYSYHSAAINTLTIDPQRTSQHGLNLAYTRNVSRHIGLTFDASAHFKRESEATTASTFESKRDQYYLLGGVQFAASNGRRVRPFAHALAGASLFRGLTTDRSPAGNVFTIDDATSFAMAFGGGLDVRLSEHVAIRLIQADYAPTFFGSGRQDNLRLSFGVVFK